MDVVERDVRQQNMRPSTDSWSDVRAFEFWKRYDPTVVAFDPRLYREQLQERAVAEYGPGAVVVFDGDPMPERFRNEDYSSERWELEEGYTFVVAPPRSLTPEEQAEIAHERAYAARMQAKYDEVYQGGTPTDQAIRFHLLKMAAESRIIEIEQMARGYPEALDTRGIVPDEPGFDSQGVDDELRWLAAADEAIRKLGLERDRRLSIARGASPMDPLGFFSRALDIAQGLKQKSGTPAVMLDRLKKAGVTENEIEMTGLREFLADRKTVTRDELVDHLTTFRVPIRETLRGGESQEVREAKARFVAHQRTMMENPDDAYSFTRRDITEADEAENQRLLEALRAAEIRDQASRPQTRYRERSLEPYNPTYTENVIYQPAAAGEVVKVGEVKSQMPAGSRTSDKWSVIRLADGTLFGINGSPMVWSSE
jgi:hypothetical protein